MARVSDQPKQEEQATDVRIVEMQQIFPDEWLVIRVTGGDKPGWTTRGIVPAHSTNRDEAYQAIEKHRHEGLLKTMFTTSGKRKSRGILLRE